MPVSKATEYCYDLKLCAFPENIDKIPKDDLNMELYMEILEYIFNSYYADEEHCPKDKFYEDAPLLPPHLKNEENYIWLLSNYPQFVKNIEPQFLTKDVFLALWDYGHRNIRSMMELVPNKYMDNPNIRDEFNEAYSFVEL